MKLRSCDLIRTFVLTSTIFAMGASSQQSQTPAEIPSVTTPSKNTKPTFEPRKVADPAVFRVAVTEGRKAMQAGDYAAAERAYAQASVADPSNALAKFNLGVAQYKGKNLPESSESFAAAGQIGDPAVAEGAMFNQGDVAYSGAIAIIDSDDFKEPSDGTAQGQGNPKRKEAIESAIQAATTALTHFKDAASADQGDVDARYNAEAATRLLKILEEMKKEEEKKEEKQDQEKSDEEKKEEEKKDQDKKDQDKKEGDQTGDQQDQQKGDQGEPKEDQPKDGEPKEDGQGQEEKEQKDQNQSGDENDEQKEGDKPQQKEEKKASESKPEKSKPDESKNGKAEAQKQEGKQSDQDPQGNSTQTQAGEPIKDAPLTKQEAERLLQAVRDREKSRKEDKDAKDLAKPARRTPASKDW